VVARKGKVEIIRKFLTIQSAPEYIFRKTVFWLNLEKGYLVRDNNLAAKDPEQREKNWRINTKWLVENKKQLKHFF